MGGLETLLPTGGVGVTLAAVILYLLNANRVDRREYGEAVDREQRRANEAERRRVTAHDELERERAARRKAEDTAADDRRQVADLAAEVARLNQVISDLHTEVARLNDQRGGTGGRTRRGHTRPDDAA